MIIVITAAFCVFINILFCVDISIMGKVIIIGTVFAGIWLHMKNDKEIQKGTREGTQVDNLVDFLALHK